MNNSKFCKFVFCYIHLFEKKAEVYKSVVTLYFQLLTRCIDAGKVPAAEEISKYQISTEI